jgi:hypothetical protein
MDNWNLYLLGLFLIKILIKKIGDCPYFFYFLFFPISQICYIFMLKSDLPFFINNLAPTKNL